LKLLFRLFFPDFIAPERISIIFSIGFISVRWYSVAYIIGIIGGWYLLKFFNKKENLFDAKKIEDDSFFYVIIGIILGGRLGYVLFYNLMFYLKHPLEIFKIWHGGMSFHGGLIGVIMAFYLLAKKYKINYLSLLDIASITAPIGLFFGRIANFINQELYGRVTTSKIGVVFDGTDGLPRHPSQLYEAFSEGLLLFCIMFFMANNTNALKRKGCMVGTFLFGYGISRFFVEFFREPDNQVGYLLTYFTLGQLLCVPMIMVGIYFIYKAVKTKNLKKNCKTT
jgi:phosphatidylglycerol:prolipoprotein diacylglycerol transferase